MKKRTKVILRTVAAVCLVTTCAVIFYMSGMPAKKSSAISKKLTEKEISIFVPEYSEMNKVEKIIINSTTNYRLRKAAHFTLFAALGFFAAALASSVFKRKFISFIASFGFSVLYAASDEFHQLFVSSRTALVSDVIIDAGGAMAGICIFFLIYFVILLIKNNKLRRKKIENR